MASRTARRRGTTKPRVGSAASRFPGDPGVGRYHIGVADGPRQLTDPAGNALNDFDACASWSLRPTAIYHDYASNTPNRRLDTGSLDSAISNNCIPSQSFKLWNTEEPPNQIGFKPAEIVAGQADADLQASATACIARAPWPIWLCYYHEPEENFPSTTEAANYRAAYRYIVQYFRNAGVTNVAWCPIYMCPWTFSSGSGRDWRRWHADWKGTSTNTSADWWTGADKMMDLFGLDIYNANINQTVFDDFDTDIIGVMMTDLTANAFISTYGDPVFAIFEFGMSSDTSPWPGAAWSTYGAAVRDWALDTAAGIVYWNHNTGQTPSRYEFTAAADTDGTKLAGWRVITAAAIDYPPAPPVSAERTFVGADADGGNVTSLTGISWPNNVQAGDTAILWWTMSTSVVPTPAPPTGFTLIETYDANSGSQRNYLYYKVCSGSESGTLTLTLDLSTRQTANLWVGRGFHATTPIDGFSKFDETAVQTTHDAPSYTLVAADCAILTLVAERGTTGTNDYTPPAGFDQNHIDTLGLAVGSGGTITAIASDDLNTGRLAGAVVNPGNWVSANGFATANAVVYTLALKPA